MQVIVAVDPTADPGWVENALRVFPLGDPLDIVLVSALDIPRPPRTSPGRTALLIPIPVYDAISSGPQSKGRRSGQEAASEPPTTTLSPGK